MQKFLSRKELVSLCLSFPEDLPKKEDHLRRVKRKTNVSFDEYFLLPNKKKHGEEIRKYGSGKILSRCWENGVLHGPWKISVGNDYLEGGFWDGLIHGVFRSEIGVDGLEQLEQQLSGKLRKSAEYTFLMGLLQSERGHLGVYLGPQKLFSVEQPEKHLLWDKEGKNVIIGDTKFFNIRDYSSGYISRNHHVLSENYLMHFLESEGQNVFATTENGEIVALRIPKT